MMVEWRGAVEFWTPFAPFFHFRYRFRRFCRFVKRFVTEMKKGVSLAIRKGRGGMEKMETMKMKKNA